MFIKNGFQDQMLALARRFQYAAGPGENLKIENDPFGIRQVPEDVLAAVDYDRVTFNWPNPSLPQANFFALQSMALESLQKRGYCCEARQLQRAFKFLRPDYQALPALLHHFLDFSPPAENTQDHLKKLGLDSDQWELKLKKKERLNPLQKKKMTFSEEWAWLVENEKTTTSYGKDAPHEMSGEGIDVLLEMWFEEIRLAGGYHPAQGINPDIPGNRAWFEKAFPMGWISLDCFQETATITAKLDFKQRIKLLLWEEIHHQNQGLKVEEIRRFAVSHKNTIGLNGDAFLSMKAIEYWNKKVEPVLLDKHRVKAPEDSTTRYLKWANPEITSEEPEIWCWIAYESMFPEAAKMVMDLWVKNGEADSALRHSLIESLFLRFSGFKGSAWLWPSAPPLQQEDFSRLKVRL